MWMEEEYFNGIIKRFSLEDPGVRKGKVMSSEAITYRGKVVAFLSPQNKMVFRLGKNFDTSVVGFQLKEFIPFKKRGPLSGWFEVAFEDNQQWEPLAQRALTLIEHDS